MNWEIAVHLPLGVVANQLLSIESDLRMLNMKAVQLRGHDDSGNTHRLDARLERIRETLESVQNLIADFSADLHPKPTAKAKARDSQRQANDHSSIDD